MAIGRKTRTKTSGAETPKKRGRGRPSVDTYPFNLDTDWFDARMRDLRIGSWAELARLIGIDKAMLNKSKKGDRIFTVKDVAGLASKLEVSADEIMRRIGYSTSERTVMVVGRVLPDGRISAAGSRKGELQNVPDAPPGAVALTCDGIPGYNEAVFIYVPEKSGKPVPLTVFDQLSVVEADEHLTPLLGTPIKMSKNRLAIKLFGSGDRIEVEKLHSAAPIVSIHFG